MLTADFLRKTYLDFTVSKGHKIVPSASLIPQNNASLIYVNSGMFPLIPYLLGEPHPLGKRITSIQKCIRTEDIDSVGNTFYHTFFEMLGHWSLGDYFKTEAIEITYEFLTKKLKIPHNKIFVTIFKGNKNIPYDKESEEAWLKQNISKENIFALDESENWWIAGEKGPCGTDTEIYVDTGKNPCGKKCKPSCKCGKYLEIWNNVFIEFNKLENGNLIPLKQKGVDVGVGLDRTVSILENVDDNYKCSHWLPVIKKIEKVTGAIYQKNTKNLRVLADHSRAIAFILAEGVVPSNVEQGYILRRLIRRSMRVLFTFNANLEGLKQIVETIIPIYKEHYPELEKSKATIYKELVREQEKFSKCLVEGTKMFNKNLSHYKSEGKIPEKDAFDLYQSYGFPVEMTKEMALEHELNLNEEEFYKMLKKHQETSRTSAKGFFKGGLAGNSNIETKYHTATHLLHKALRDELGQDVFQKGSNINADRLRFDFSYPSKMTLDQLKNVEDAVNNKIKEELEVSFKTMSLEDALKENALAFFKETYPNQVKVFSIGNYSKEICGGPHVKNLKELGNFKIIKEESVASGIRRIKAVLLDTKI